MTWPDWSGRPLVIVASGPTAKQVDYRPIEGRATIVAIKRTLELVPFADAVYGCDRWWWQSVHGLPDFKGYKFCWDPAACDRYRLRRVEITPQDDVMHFGAVGKIGAGGNSGFQVLNLAVQLGARQIILAGFDCHDRGGVHWYGRNTGYKMGNPCDINFQRWIGAFAAAAPLLSEHGADIVNASPDSAIKCFRSASISEAMTGWGA